MLTPVEAAGIRASIQLLGSHPSAKVLEAYLAESGVEPEFGSTEEMQRGVMKGIEICKEHNVAYVNPKNLCHILDTDARVNDVGRREVQSETTEVAGEDSP